MPTRERVVVDATDAYERGRQRGTQVSAGIAASWPIYRSLFELTAREAGRSLQIVGGQATACLDALSSWSPTLLRELEGIAAGADVRLETVAALNARTEVFAAAGGVEVTECSTIVELVGPAGSALSAQTWDWHAELAAGWHLNDVRGSRYAYVGLCEFGMLAKIGVNGAGLGLHFNLLRHASDTGATYDDEAPRAGVPVHIVAAAILAEASTVDEAVELARSAPLAASTVVTVVTAHQAAALELSPAGVAVVPPMDGWLVHTNHFLDPGLALGEGVPRAGTTTIEREALLSRRATAAEAPLAVEDLTHLLGAHDAGAAVCRHLDVSMPHGYRSATLATVALDPGHRQAHVSDDGPCRRTHVTTLTAAG